MYQLKGEIHLQAHIYYKTLPMYTTTSFHIIVKWWQFEKPQITTEIQGALWESMNKMYRLDVVIFI